MTGKKVEIESVWYDLFSFPLDLMEWLGIASLLVSSFFVYHGKIPTPLFTIGVVIVILGIFISFWSKKSIFEGRRQFENQFGGGYEEVSKIITEGPYRYTRHPWYIANTIQALGVSIIWSSLMFPWVLFLGPIVLLMSIMRAEAEEEWLVAEFPEYGGYKNSVGFLFPSRT